ncbi:MAG: iron complex outerrane recepter protein [Gammaproteobacteria bacterium]|jgi:outer membrane receptor protein involved in Fe transport|nr:iron complex outerrane recepter protein [Gammaproteobacteria bacterium]
MTNNRIIWKTIHGLLAAAACAAASAALAAEPVANEMHTWNIQAEDAPAALRDFGVQSGVAISAQQKDLAGKRLNAVTGSLTVDSALRQLVAGTGLKYVYDASGRAVTLTPEKPASAESPAQTNTRRDPPASAGTAADTALLLEEIVVTARKRTENLQDVPISAEVISGQTLAESSIRSLSELSQSIPGIQLNSTGASGQFFIRGIGSGSNLTFDQSVGTFIDDIYHGRARVADEGFLDLDRVEVLKGPQSTFFGNNAVAGALNIVTAKPTEEFGGSVRALYGQYGQYAGEGMLNLPLNSDFAVRIAVIGDGMSGWAKDPYAGEDKPVQNNKAGRITLLYHPSDVFDATLKVEGGTNHQNDGGVVGDCPPPAPFVSPPGAANFCAAAIKAGYTLAVNNFRDTTNSGQGNDLSTFEDVLTMHYRIGEDTLTSVSGFYNYHFQENVDADGTPMQLLNLQVLEAYHQVSQELRIASPQGETFEYLAGLYFQNDHLVGNANNLNDFYLSTAANQTANPTLAPYLKAGAVGASQPYEQAEHSYAAFASAGWNVTEQLKVGAGLRGSWVYKSAFSNPFDGYTTSPYGGLTPFPTAALTAAAVKLAGTPKPAWSAQDSYNSVMPSAEIDYKITPSVMVYSTYAKGFLAGVPTDVGYVPPATGVSTPPILPEHVNAYEVGIKSSLFDDHLRLNLDVFRSNYTDLQVANFTIGANGANVAQITNAASSRTQGVELSEDWALNGFRLKTVATYLNARYLDYPNVTLTAAQTYCRTTNPKAPGCLVEFPNGVPASQNLAGQHTSYAPTVSGSVTASYTAVLPRGYHFITEADVNATTNYFYGNGGTNDPEQKQPGYARLDGRLSLESPSTRWAVDLIFKNLTDKIIILGGAGGTSLPASAGSTLLQIDQPRNVAVQARYQW